MTQPPDGPGGPEGPVGSVRPTTPAAPVLAGCLGLVAGWAIRPVALARDLAVPGVSWLQVLVLGFVAAVVTGTAWLTWRQLQVQRFRIEAHRAVNRLLLARSCILVGALLAGGYAGYAMSWLGIDSEVADERMLRSGVAVLLAVALIAAAIWLERACRVRDDEGADLA